MNLNSGRLHEGFVLAKPISQENYDEKIIYDLERQGRLVITRKRDGWKLLALVGPNGEIRLYTDGINEIDSRLDHIKDELRSLSFPSNTLVVGEAIVDMRDSDDLTKVISIFHSNLAKAQDLQKEYGRIRFMVFAIVPLGDASGFKNSPLNSYGISISEKLRAFNESRRKLGYVFPVPVLNTSFDEAKQIVIEKGWEGLVLYDKDYQLTFRTDGKAPKRPRGCYKWKPILEDDFIVRSWIPRPGNKSVKELVLLQIDPVTQGEFYCGKLGSFNNEMRSLLAKMIYPIVVQARFDTRYPKTGKIRNQRFVMIRTDKPVHQCVAPKSYPEMEISV
ncbi:MAG TPA: hypothetical protein VJJ72_02110 [Candidatus Paceibacterota bacterium]